MEAEEKLVWLGIKTNAAKVNQLSEDVKHLQDTVGDWGEFTDLVEDDTDSYEELKTELVDQGWSEGQADNFIARLQNEFNSYNDFQSSVGGFESYDELQSLFDSASTFAGDSMTESGAPAAGIRIHESDGVSYAGVDVPAGTTEVFGSRIEFSQQDPARGAKESVTYANFTSDDPDNVETVFGTITFSADVTNPNGFPVDAEVPLQEDGSVIRTKTISLGANETVNVEFDVRKEDYICADYSIGNSDPILACWVPAGLII